MPPRPTARCRALQSTAAATEAAAVWVTDDVLHQAFQRFVSSVPGPMYHRKRFGRRQMTELNTVGSGGSALPVWAMGGRAQDLMKWQWLPPKAELWSTPPREIVQSAAHAASETPAQSQSSPEEEEQEPEAAIAKEPLHHSINIGLGSSSAAWKKLSRTIEDMLDSSATADAYQTRFEDWTADFYKLLSTGQLHGSSTAHLFRLGRKSLISARRLWPHLTFEHLSLQLLSTISKGTQLASAADPSFVIAAPWFWGSFLQHWIASQHTFKPSNMRVFVFGMHKAKIKQQQRDYDITFKALEKFFAMWKGSELHGHAGQCDHAEIETACQLASIWSGRGTALLQVAQSKLEAGEVVAAAQALRIAARCLARVERFTCKMAHLMSYDADAAQWLAKALEVKSLRRDRVLFVQATMLLGPPRQGCWSRAHYTWLQVMARLPEISSPALKGLLNLFPARGMAALSHVELCELWLLHWESRGKLARYEAARQLWKSKLQEQLPTVAALALAINKTHSPIQATAIFWDLWNFLSSRIGKKAFVRQLSALGEAKKISPNFLQRLAWTSRDHRIALLLHDVLCKSQGKMCRFWWPPFWAKMAAKYNDRWKYHMIDPLQLANRLTAPGPTAAAIEAEEAATRNLPRLVDKMVDPKFNANLPAAELAFSTPQRTVASLQDYGNDAALGASLRHRAAIRDVRNSLRLVGSARQLTDRQALRHVTLFTSFLANKQGYLTARDLSTLTAVITRTLSRGEPGSVQRLRWYLDVIRRHLGEDVCVRIGRILQERRESNWHAWKRGLIVAQSAQNLKRRHRLPSLWWSFIGRNRRQEARRRRLRARRQQQQQQQQQSAASGLLRGRTVKKKQEIRRRQTTGWSAPVPNPFLAKTEETMARTLRRPSAAVMVSIWQKSDIKQQQQQQHQQQFDAARGRRQT